MRSTVSIVEVKQVDTSVSAGSSTNRELPAVQFGLFSKRLKRMNVRR